MGSFAFFFLAGLYPLPATRQLLLSSPYFPNISFYNPLYDKTTTIKVNNFVGNPSDGIGGTVFVKVNLFVFTSFFTQSQNLLLILEKKTTL